VEEIFVTGDFQMTASKNRFPRTRRFLSVARDVIVEARRLQVEAQSRTQWPL
jgi:hypothetical protein